MRLPTCKALSAGVDSLSYRAPRRHQYSMNRATNHTGVIRRAHRSSSGCTQGGSCRSIERDVRMACSRRLPLLIPMTPSPHRRLCRHTVALVSAMILTNDRIVYRWSAIAGGGAPALALKTIGHPSGCSLHIGRRGWVFCLFCRRTRASLSIRSPCCASSDGGRVYRGTSAGNRYANRC